MCPVWSVPFFLEGGGFGEETGFSNPKKQGSLNDTFCLFETWLVPQK